MKQNTLKIEAITLDLDDTLWPVLPTLIAAEKTLSDWLQENAPASAAHLNDSVRQKIRASLVARYPQRAHDMSWLRLELLREGFREAGDDPALAQTAFELFLAARQRVTFYEEVHDVLAHWSAHYPLVAISNGNADLHRVGLGSYFTAAVSAHECDFAKPDRRMFEMACERTGAAAESTLHIGDDWHLDVQAARDAGMQAAWIRRPDLKHKLSADDDADVPVFEDLHALDCFLHA